MKRAWAKLAERVEHLAALVGPRPLDPLKLRIVVFDDSDELHIEAAKEWALAAHLIRHPQDKGRPIEWQAVKSRWHMKSARDIDYRLRVIGGGPYVAIMPEKSPTVEDWLQQVQTARHA
jgi:hypothetical protein